MTNRDVTSGGPVSNGELTETLGLGRLRTSVLVGRGVIRPVKDPNGDVVGWDRESVTAVARRRANRGPAGAVWDAVKTVFRWMP